MYAPPGFEYLCCPPGAPPALQACALLGVLVGPLSYLTVWELTHSNLAALLAGVMVVCETGTLILSQYILLDPSLLFFISATTFCTAKFVNCRHE